jgi:hypothetical protein
MLKKVLERLTSYQRKNGGRKSRKFDGTGGVTKLGEGHTGEAQISFVLAYNHSHMLFTCNFAYIHVCLH